MKNDSKGFTLVELLATILLIGVILGIATTYLITTIGKAEKTSTAISDNSIIDISKTYLQEFPDEVVWQKENIDTNNVVTCISINDLINKGYYTPSIKDKISKEYVIITKDQNNNIISEKMDTNNQCDNLGVKIPTKEKYCKNQTYNGSLQTLTKDLETDSKYTFTNNEQKNAGLYEVIAILKEGYHWQDGSNTPKTINCEIKKAKPTLELSPNGIETLKVGTPKKIKVNSNTSGTLKLTPSNKEYTTAKIATGNSNHITPETGTTFEVIAMSSKKVEAFVTVTLIPDDQKNYYTNSTNLLINKQERNIVKIPTEKEYCIKDLYYDGTPKKIVKDPGIGFIFKTTKGTNQGKYKVTAQLKYGYIWEDGTTSDKQITCEIKRMHKITLDNQGATTKGTEKLYERYKEGIYSTKEGIVPTKKITIPTKNGHKFMGYYTDKNAKKTKLIDKDGNLTSTFTATYFDKDATIYAKWVSNATLVCDNSKYNWSNTEGRVDITANNATSHFGGIEYRAGNEKNFGKTPNIFYQYSKNNVYHVLSKAVDDEGNVLGEKWCTTKLDNLKPYTPIFFNISETNGAVLESETCSSLPHNSTKDLECTVTVRAWNNTQGFRADFVIGDQPATNCNNCSGSGQSGIDRVEAMFEYYDTYPNQNRPNCTDKHYDRDDLPTECSNFLIRKFHLKSYDKAGNVSGNATINVIYKPNHTDPNRP